MLSANQPDWVLIELGGNDGLRGLPLSLMRENFISMIEMIKGAGAQPILAGIQIPPNYGRRYTEPFFSQYSELAAEYSLPLIPFLIDGIPQRPELMQDDGIHPRAEAQGIILENVWPVLSHFIEP
jgi:acyl-CoA thioesterase-1